LKGARMRKPMMMLAAGAAFAKSRKSITAKDRLA
jgi:hypothetical protein